MNANSFLKIQIDKHAMATGELPALIHSDKIMNYCELKKTIESLSVTFTKDQLSSVSPVIVFLPMGINLAIIISSLLYYKIPAIVLPSGYKLAELINLTQKYPFTALLTNDENLEKILGVLSPTKISETCLEDISLVSLKAPSERDLGFEWLLYTSGTTSLPKMVKLSMENLENRTTGEIDLFGLKNHGRLLNLLPFSHDLGLNQLLTSLFTGSALEILVNKLPLELALKISDGKFDGITGMPQIWNNFIQIVDKTKMEIKYTGFLTVSGGSLSAENLIKLKNIFKAATIYKTYGQTETFRTFAETRQDQIELNQCGQLVSGVGAFIINENGKHCQKGEVGELFHYGRGVMSGYWMDESLTEKKLQKKEGQLGVLTGDYFQLMGDGEVQFAGRRDDMVKHSGRRFFLGEIEHCLMNSGLLQEACVMQVEDDRPLLGSDKLVAFILVNNNTENLSKELKNYCAQKLETFKVPDQFILCDSFPYTSSHKINRKELIKTHYGK